MKRLYLCEGVYIEYTVQEWLALPITSLVISEDETLVPCKICKRTEGVNSYLIIAPLSNFEDITDENM